MRDDSPEPDSGPVDSDPADSNPAIQPLASAVDKPTAKNVSTALPVGAWVRVSQQRLLSAPDVNARLELASEQPFRIAEVVTVEGEFVELRTVVAKPEDLCATTSGADPSFELHFFAKIDALETVLLEPKIVEFDDGTKLEFAAGVPVDLVGSEPRLRLGGASFVVPLAKQEIGRSFPAALAQLPATSPTKWSPAGPLHYGERSVEPDGSTFADIRGQRRLDDKNVLLTFADACGRFTLRLEGDVPRAPLTGLYEIKGPGNSGSLGDVPWIPPLQPDRVWQAPSGVPVTWRDSDEIAGVTRTKVELPTDAQEVEGKVCFTTGEMSVCIASERLTYADAPKGVTLAELQRNGPQDHAVEPGEVRQLQATVSPGLDADIVRRIVKAHMNELRSCHGAGLKKDPKLAGIITIAFEIGANGKVPISTVQESTIDSADQTVASCFAKAVKRWQFPKPRGGATVSVSYPFELLSK
jgi:hypothetical protein